MVTNFNTLDLNQSYSYSDYLKWQFEERLELIKGKIFKMSPAPNRRHQEIAGVLHGIMWTAFQNKHCKLYSAPFDVRLYDSKKSQKEDTEIYTVVQPDLCVICDKEKLDDRGAIGAPDLIIEIISPGNSDKEMKNKYELYEESGVKEYWIVNPSECVVLRYILKNEKYHGLAPLIKSDVLTSEIFPELAINLEKVFAEN